MGIYKLCSSLTIPALLPGSIKSNPDGFQMFSLLAPVVISLFFIRRDKFWLREISLPVNNAIKNKSGASLSTDPANSCAQLRACRPGVGTGCGWHIQVLSSSLSCCLWGSSLHVCPDPSPAAPTRLFCPAASGAASGFWDVTVTRGVWTHPCPDCKGTELPTFWGSRLFPWGSFPPFIGLISHFGDPGQIPLLQSAADPCLKILKLLPAGRDEEPGMLFPQSHSVFGVLGTGGDWNTGKGSLSSS